MMISNANTRQDNYNTLSDDSNTIPRYSYVYSTTIITIIFAIIDSICWYVAIEYNRDRANLLALTIVCGYIIVHMIIWSYNTINITVEDMISNRYPQHYIVGSCILLLFVFIMVMLVV